MAYTTINKPSLHFNTVLYSGDGTSNRGITGTGFQPDLVVNKGRTFSSGAYNWYTFDSVRTLGGRINWNTTAAEDDKSAEFISFDSDGFTVTNNAGSLNINGSGVTYANFCWKADNTSGSSNTDGSITSTVSANTTSGFSIVKYTGTGSAATIGHGLGVAPKMIIAKNLGDARSWGVYHASLGATQPIDLDGSGAAFSSSTYWNDTSPTTSVFSTGGGNNTGSAFDFIAYCFAEKKGFSKFGSYVGNGNADGTFVYTGFKPAFLIYKVASGTTGSWGMLDNKRDPFNVTDATLTANGSGAEAQDLDFDFVSNGVKIRSAGGSNNQSGATYIYIAFAESPLVSSNGVPNTAR